MSSNDLIAKDGTIYELVQYPRKAWHAGTWNRKGYGIEICNRGSASDPYPQAQIDAVVWRARERRRALNIPPDPARIKRHRDVSPTRSHLRHVPLGGGTPADRRAHRPDRRRRPERPARRGFALEKFNIAGLGLRYGVMATALAGALRSEGASAMSVHSAQSIAFTAKRASVAVLAGRG